ncbi:MAG: type III pantothenate kinase [Crocinitomicaceae bacterium]
MNLVVDQGNTQFKVGIFNDSNLIETFRCNYEKSDELMLNLKSFDIKKIIVSSVVEKKLNFEFLRAELMTLTSQTNIPIQNQYKTPETLGLDRIANAVGAWKLNHKANSLVIDLGTCIKYDLVSENGSYLGGNIAPGLQMRFKALYHFTSQLPLLAPDRSLKQTHGINTETSIQCGIMDGINHEIKGFIDRYNKEFSQLTIFMTGGDLKYFDKRDKKSIFAHQNLTLIGLNEILKHNA